MGWKLVHRNKVVKVLKNDLSIELLEGFFKGNLLLVNADKTKKIILASQELFNVFDKVKSKGVQPLFLGSGVADTQDFKRARLNLAFATKVSGLDLPKVVIGEKAEQLFLYGRDVWSNSIREISGPIKRRGLVFIFNEEELFVGLAFAMADQLLGKGNKVVLKNVIDIGNYLRVEK